MMHSWFTIAPLGSCRNGPPKFFFTFLTRLYSILSLQKIWWHEIDEVDIEEKHTRKGNHYPELIPGNEKKEKPQKRCCLCYKEGIRKETRYQCDTCRKHTALCPAPCFRIYHEN